MTNKAETQREKLNEFFVSCFYSILDAEQKALESISNGKLSLKEIHVIEAVFKAKTQGKNTFSHIASVLNIVLGTLTTSFTRLEKKGYLTKRQDQNDKRVFYIEPTPLGHFVNESHDKWHQRMVDGIIKTISEKDLDDLIHALEVLDTFFKEKL